MGDELGCSVLTCGRRPIRKSGKQKARTRIARRGRYDLFDDRSMPVICPTGQGRAKKKSRRVSRNDIRWPICE